MGDSARAPNADAQARANNENQHEGLTSPQAMLAPTHWEVCGRSSMRGQTTSRTKTNI